ncbi:hypothetical protein E4U23_001945 [Claviceps purpurea]|nr:hypothetical protein E4U23_001945 [Claviceps purpurea]
MPHETLAIKAAETSLEYALFVLDDPFASAAEVKIHAASALIGNAASSAIGKSAEWRRY